jgi:hypothetical protein
VVSEDKSDDTKSGPPMFNIVAGILLAAVSLWLLNVAIPNNIGQAAGKNDISPALFPTFAAWFLLALSLSLVAIHVAKLRVQGSRGAGREGVWVLGQLAVWIVVAILAYLGIQTIGFMPVAIALIGLGALGCGYRNYWVICGLAIVTPVILTQLAWLIFTVDLP